MAVFRNVIEDMTIPVALQADNSTPVDDTLFSK